MYAVIDIGSNTIRLVLYRVVDGEIHQMLNSKAAAGLVGYIDEKNCLSAKGIRKAVTVLNRFLQTLKSVEVEHFFAFATASLRNINNTEEVLDALWAECGVRVRVLTGDEEAVFDYFGAIKSLAVSDGLMVDVGGGSTELVLFARGEVVATRSLPMGSLSLYTAYVHGIVPTKKELDQIAEHAARLLRPVDFPGGEQPTAVLCGVGGTARASCQLSDELFDETSGYGGYPCRRMKKILKLVKSDRGKLVPAMIKAAPDRLHTLLPGLAVLQAVAERYGCRQFTASPYGVREGYLLYMLEGGEANG
ncbi:phosphatase [Oscillibacter sp. MSJ-2]|uniref:Phosphatase n=1 Tax=Dysosmobacter acutus TaxID=2841504 RepID=A0ABS6F9G0_9FIRM|nr:phosphatase [Dysosmobacter acutus]MBU5626942.1 phosphatase [Dysosmobacter acutus]